MTSKGKSGGSGGSLKAKSHSPVSGKTRLIRWADLDWLQINRNWYLVHPVDMIQDGEGLVAVLRLKKIGLSSNSTPIAAMYDITKHRDGSLSCDCADFIYRRANGDCRCKHLAALRAVGLLEGR